MSKDTMDRFGTLYERLDEIDQEQLQSLREQKMTQEDIAEAFLEVFDSTDLAIEGMGDKAKAHITTLMLMSKINANSNAGTRKFKIFVVDKSIIQPINKGKDQMAHVKGIAKLADGESGPKEEKSPFCCSIFLRGKAAASVSDLEKGESYVVPLKGFRDKKRGFGNLNCVEENMNDELTTIFESTETPEKLRDSAVVESFVEGAFKSTTMNYLEEYMDGPPVMVEGIIGRVINKKNDESGFLTQMILLVDSSNSSKKKLDDEDEC